MRQLRWFAWSFLLPGLGLLAGAGFAAWQEIDFRRGAVEVEGRIVAMRATSDSDGDRVWTPVFAFKLPDGREVRVAGSYASSPPCCRVGDAVRVRYDPAHPERAAMEGFMSSWFLATLLGGLGVVFTGVGLLLRRLLRRVGATGGASVAGLVTVAVPARLAGLRQVQGPQGRGWVVQARGIDPRSGAERLYESEPLPFDPTPQMMRMTSVTVAVQPLLGPEADRMDLSFLRDPGPTPPPMGPVRRG